MDLDPRWWLLLGSNILLFWLTGMVNDALGPLGIQLSLGALYVIMPAVCLSHGWGVFLVFITGLMIDASLPVTFGFHAVIFAVAITLLHGFQPKLARAGLGQLILLALAFNTGFILIEGFLLADSLLGFGLYWLRLSTDILVSSLAIGIAGWWFFAWERWLLLACGSSLAAPEKS